MTAEPVVTAVILAHQGGWDEILLVLTPIVAIVLVLRLVKRRVDAAGPVDGPPAATVDDAHDADDVTRH